MISQDKVSHILNYYKGQQEKTTTNKQITIHLCIDEDAQHLDEKITKILLHSYSTAPVFLENDDDSQKIFIGNIK